MNKQLPIRFASLLFPIVLLTQVSVAEPRIVVTPGQQISPVSIGMSHASVKKLSKKDAKYKTYHFKWQADAKHPSPSVFVTEEYIGNPYFTEIMYINNKVVQIETEYRDIVAEDGVEDCPQGSISNILSDKNLKLYCYGFTDKYGAGANVYYYDDVKRGIAYTHETQDAEVAFDIIAGKVPSHPSSIDSIIVHRPNYPVIARHWEGKVTTVKPSHLLEVAYLRSHLLHK